MSVTAERIDRAIRTVARAMIDHNMPHLEVTIRYLEAERDKLNRETTAMDYAKKILQKDATKEVTSPIGNVAK